LFHSVVYILIIVVRSKLVTDFSVTIHFINLIFTTFYTRAIPSSIFWWAVQGASALLMTVLGVWACQWRELRPISFGFGGSSGTTNGNATTNRADDGAGFPQSRGTNDGYELVDRSETV
jgi:protein SYS1